MTAILRALLCCALFALLPLTSLPAVAAQPDQPPTVMILFDGSGSMWGRIEGDKGSKFYVARDAFRQFLPRVRQDVRTGLASFGHRRRSDCSDVEIIAPPEAGNATRLIDPIDKLNPKGKGPLALALHEAAAAIGTGPVPGSIVVVSDGPDNCQQDACAMAGDLKKANPRLVIHMVSIASEPQDAPAMACVPAKTGGKLFEVRDAAALTAAIGDALTLANLDVGGPAVRSPSAKATPKAGGPETEGPSRIRLSAALAAGAEGVELPVDWRIVRDDGTGASVLEKTAPRIAEMLPAGSYVIEARLGLVSKQQKVSVKEKGETAVEVGLDAGLIRVASYTHKGSEPIANPIFTLSTPPASGAAAGARGKVLWIGRDATPEIALPAGSYTIRVDYGLASQVQAIDIAAGKVIPIDMVLGSGRLDLSAVDRDGGHTLDGVMFILDEPDPDAPEGRREIARSAAPNPSFQLPAGTYQVTARFGTAEVRQRVAIGGGEAVTRTLVLGLARVTVATTAVGPALPPRAPLVTRALALDPKPREVARASTPSPEFQLPAGKYRFEAQVGIVNAAATVDLDVAAGAVLTVPLKLEVGQVSFRLAGGAGWGRDDFFWEIFDGSGNPVWRTSQAEPRNVLLAPGGYVARSQFGDRKYEKPFAVKPGDQLAVEIKVE